ncbi:right-handed parallel beta-helix repeat-containing protein [Naasia sp. SYSU D00057]|uniref:right-handed parallel beta-helix repeat-containing protein n=1 Tax=Naasia sp. SYSU D00057 TaxID=2817380 RepID=UPI001B30B899|nr:right-handed parallel beta-helix repeat-containing protein [Naasia sp. SYSU D00057]
MRRRGTTLVAVAAGVLMSLAVPNPSQAAVGDAEIVGAPYPGDPDAEAGLVEIEGDRLAAITAAASAARVRGSSVLPPYRVLTGEASTLVLTARSEPYVLADLQALSPEGLLQLEDGSWLLSENVVVASGATLRLADAPGLVLHLASGPSGFASIVSLDGSVEIAGAEDAPVTIDAWDATMGRVDAETADGRAYLRLMGGHVSIAHARFESLGFWSGNTGGVSITGPDTEAASIAPATGDPVPTVDVSGGSTPDAALPSGSGLPQGAPLTAEVVDSAFTGNTFGLFVKNADGVRLERLDVRDSLVDGIVLHRGVTRSVVSDTVTAGNGVDGLVLAPGSAGIRVQDVTAEDNGRNGITVDASPLSDGPSATGTPTTAYGNDVVELSTASGNARYGIEVVGGDKIRLSGNTVEDGRMGIVVSGAASDLLVVDNEVTGATQQGIALRDGVSAARVARNTVGGSATGVYVRDSVAQIEANFVTGATRHGITVVGETTGTTVRSNILAGAGSRAIDTTRASGAARAANDASDWTSRRPIDALVASTTKPLTLLWVGLGAIVLVTALAGMRHRRRTVGHPYGDRTPLAVLTGGLVDPRTLGLPVPPVERNGKESG